MKMVEEQRAQTKARAVVYLDARIPRIFSLLSSIVSSASHQGEKGAWSWDPNTLMWLYDFDVDWDEQLLGESASVAYPGEAADIVQAFRAAVDLKRLSEEYRKQEWMRDDPQSERSNDALNRFFMYTNACGKIQPHVR